jgi:hypothetical protein
MPHDHPTTPFIPLVKSHPHCKETWLDNLEHCLPYPPTAECHKLPHSRLLRRFPFLLEVWYWLLAFGFYSLLLHHTREYINSSPIRRIATEKLAQANAVTILDFEKSIGIDFEEMVYRFVLRDCKAWVLAFLEGVYKSQVVVGVAFLGYSYTYFLVFDPGMKEMLTSTRYFPDALSKRIRRTMALSYLLSFAVLTYYRCTPPHLILSLPLPDLPGDPLLERAIGDPDIGTGNQLAVAAMPCLQFGMSLVMGCAAGVCIMFLTLRRQILTL